jgi:ATP-dependent DNA helicase RecG
VTQAAAKPNKPLAAKLAKLGLRSDADLVLHLPLRYEDETRITPLAQALPGTTVQCDVEVISAEIAFRPRRQLVAHVRDGSGQLVLRFLNFYPSQQKQMQPGARLRIFGEARGGFFGMEMVHPRCRRIGEHEPLPDCLTPVYPTTAGLGQGTLRRLVGEAMRRTDLADTLPDDLRLRLGLEEFAPCLNLLHAPPPLLGPEQLANVHRPAWRRIRFDELLAQQLSLRRAYAARRTRHAPALPQRDGLAAALLGQLPFRLTQAQERVWAEIAADIADTLPMRRLLQGDVGAGKTIIAALAVLRAAENGYQAAIMAPTEILAEQHFRKLSDWLAPLGIEVAWLSGQLKKSARNEALARIADGSARITIGTHALIEDAADFANLGLAVVDEQHRFGVNQRLALKDKAGAGGEPHQLMMSATPIPRTLAMSYYADLDVSVIDQLPPGRTPVVTKLVADGRRDEVVARVHLSCRQGRQAYWVCPLIEESETLQLQTALETYERLRGELADLRIGLVHGRLKADEKAATMTAFAAGEIDLLVATTVIEVGVDVPNASLMVIEHAERFGLAQLHQLRGRVGRGAAESACVLLYASPLGETARQRLKIIFENTDGFEIARQDLALRGPGEFIGTRQSGVPLLRYADLNDEELVEAARSAAEELMRAHPDAAEAHLRRWLAGREEMLKA